MPGIDHDLIIIGAGPSGSATALNLAKRAPHLVERTLILERHTHPRPKPCCGGLSGDALRCIQKLGLDIDELPRLRADWLHLLFGGRGFPVRIAGDHGLSVIRRNEFDAWLAGKARAKGFALQEETNVTSVRRVDGAVEVHTSRGTLRARAVVGADGSTGHVRHAVTPRSNVGVGRTLEVLVPGRSSGFPTEPCSFDGGYIEFQCIPRGFAGYVLAFPVLENGERLRSFAVWESRTTGTEPTGSLEDLLRNEMAHKGYDLDHQKLQGFPIRWYEPGLPLSAPGIVLVGDAAGVDALLGEGISQSLGYGEIAADAIADAFARGDFAFSDYAARVARSPMGRSLATRTWLAKGLYRLRSRTLQRALWQRGGRLLAPLLTRSVFGWAA